MGVRRFAVFQLVEKMYPMTVRQVFYQATVTGLVEKTEAAYQRIQGDLTHLRRNKLIPYGWIVDSTRFMRKPKSFDSPKEAIEETARLYRKAVWSDVPAYVEIWLEKDALSGVVFPVTANYDVPLMIARGYSSITFLHASADFISDLAVPAYIYHVGDFDPYGVEAANKVEETIREYAPDADIHFERLAVLPWQISEWNLQTRPTKAEGSQKKRADKHGEISVELDAIEPERLRQLVREAIEQHLPEGALNAVREAEKSERKLINGLIGMLD
jgi:hypothetical protein